MKTILCKLTCVLSALLLLSSCGSANGAEAFEPKLSVHFFSAGKADAMVLVSDGHAAVIDTGKKGFGGDMADYLKAEGIEKLDLLIISHFDKDHVGGAAKLLKAVQVGKVIVSSYPGDSVEYKKFMKNMDSANLDAYTPAETETFELGSCVLTVYPSEKQEYSKDSSNNSSLIVGVECGERRLLFTGDAVNERLQEFVLLNTGAYDFVKMPYHGEWMSALNTFVGAVCPRYAVICCSEAEPESKKTAELLEKSGVETYLTRVSPVELLTDGSSILMEYN